MYLHVTQVCSLIVAGNEAYTHCVIIKLDIRTGAVGAHNPVCTQSRAGGLERNFSVGHELACRCEGFGCRVT